MNWFLPSSAGLADPLTASFQHVGLTADGFAHDLLGESARSSALCQLARARVCCYL